MRKCIDKLLIWNFHHLSQLSDWCTPAAAASGSVSLCGLELRLSWCLDCSLHRTPQTDSNNIFRHWRRCLMEPLCLLDSGWRGTHAWWGVCVSWVSCPCSLACRLNTSCRRVWENTGHIHTQPAQLTRHLEEKTEGWYCESTGGRTESSMGSLSSQSQSIEQAGRRLQTSSSSELRLPSGEVWKERQQT